MRRPHVTAVLALMCLVVPATPSHAWWDFFAYLEELSGPGPFGGYELSLEVGCFELGTKHDVPPSDVRAARDVLMAPLQNAITQTLTGPPGAPPQIETRVLTPREQAVLNALVTPQIRAAILSGAARTGRNAAGENTFANTTRSRVNEGRLWSCSASEQAFSRAISTNHGEADAQILNVVGGGDAIKTITVRERGPKTGVVLGIGRYKSRQNKLFDPSGPDEPNPRTAGPQVRVWTIEGLFHHKLTSAVDVGAGAGVTVFEGDRAGGGSFTSEHFHFVPLSVVVKPVAFLTTNRFGQAFGLRLGSRFMPGRLDGEDFGVAKERFTQRGELLWSISTYIDLATLLHVRRGSR